MKLIEFPEQTVVIAKDQPKYNPMPAHQVRDREGTIICCWKLSWKERFKIMLGGKLWHRILTFNGSIQPQLIEVDSPFIKSV